MEPNYANPVINNNKSYTNCGIIAVVVAYNIEHIMISIGKFFEHCSKA